MITEIKNFRAKYPDYDDMDDLSLANKLAQKYPESYIDLPDKVRASLDLPQEEFARSNYNVPQRQEKISQDYPVRRAIMNQVRPLLEYGGMAVGGIGGGIIGSGVTPIVGTAAGSVAGAGLGYSAGSGAADFLEEQMGIRKPTPYGASLTGRLHKAASDFVAGSEMEMMGQGIGKAVGTIARKVEPLTSEAKRVAEIAKRENIKFTPADMSQTKGESLIEMGLFNAPASATKTHREKLKTIQGLDRFREKILAEGGSPTAAEDVGLKVKAEIDDLISKANLAKTENLNTVRNNLLRFLGSNETYESLGQSTQELIKKASQVHTNKAKEVYASLSKIIPEGTEIPLNNLQKVSQSILEQEKLKPLSLRNNDLVKVLEDLSGSNEILDKGLEGLGDFAKQQIKEQLASKGLDWNSLQAIRSEFGNRIASHDAAIKMNQQGLKYSGDPTGGVYKQLRKALDQDIADFSESQGGLIKETMDMANSIYREGKLLFNRAEVIKAMKNNPERLLDIVIKPGDVTGIKKIKEILGPTGFEPLKNKFTQRLFESSENFESIQKELNKYGKETLRNIYSPNELGAINSAIEGAINIQKTPVTDQFFTNLVKSLERNPEKVADLIIKPNNTKTILKTKQVLSEKTWSEVEGKFLEKLMKENKELAGQAEPLLSPAKFETQVFKMGDSTLKAALSHENYTRIKELALLSKYAQTAEKMAGNPSGTAQNVITWSTMAMVFTNPAIGIPMYITPRIFAQFYFSPTGFKLFTKGIKTPVSSPQAAELASKISSIFARSQSEDNIFEYNQGGQK